MNKESHQAFLDKYEDRQLELLEHREWVAERRAYRDSKRPVWVARRPNAPRKHYNVQPFTFADMPIPRMDSLRGRHPELFACA